MRNPGHTSLGMAGSAFTDHGAQTLAGGSVTMNARMYAGTVLLCQRETPGANPGFLDLANRVNGEAGSIDIVSDDALDAGDIHAYSIPCVTGGDWAGAGHDEAAVGHTPGLYGGLGGAEAGIQTGQVTLVAGTFNVTPYPNIPAGAFLFVTRVTAAGVLGYLTISDNPGVALTVASTDVGDLSTVQWFIFDPQALQNRIPSGIGSAIQAPAMVVGTGVLAGGTLVVANANASNAGTGSRFLVSRTAAAGTPGHLYAPAAVVNGVSFTVTSTNALDTSTFQWAIFNPGLFG